MTTLAAVFLATVSVVTQKLESVYNDEYIVKEIPTTNGVYNISVAEATEAGYADEADSATVGGSIDTRIAAIENKGIDTNVVLSLVADYSTTNTIPKAVLASVAAVTNRAAKGFSAWVCTEPSRVTIDDIWYDNDYDGWLFIGVVDGEEISVGKHFYNWDRNAVELELPTYYVTFTRTVSTTNTLGLVSYGELDAATNAVTTNLWGRIDAATNYLERYIAGQYVSVTGGSISGSFEQGQLCSATGDVSHAEGGETKANGGGAHAEGWQTVANGMCAHSEGFWSEANGQGSHADGYRSYANGDYSYAWGKFAHADGDHSYAIGNGAYANANYSYVIGSGTATNVKSIVIGHDGSMYSHGDKTVTLNAPDGLRGIFFNDESVEDVISAATNATYAAVTNAIGDLPATVATWENYWRGDRVRLSVTNYYGNTSSEPPRLRIEESQTNALGVVTNWVQVWDEVTRQTNYYNAVNEKVDNISNSVMTAAYKQTYNQLAAKAPRAWGTVTSTGTAAPEGKVWITEPNTVFAGGTEYAHVAVGDGVICVLTDNGAPVYTEGAEGQFRFKDDSGENYFGFDVSDGYTIGCRTDGISVQGTMVTLTYDLTSSSDPTILVCTNLLTGTWAEAEVDWEESPPAGTKVCYINTNTNRMSFYKAQISYASSAKFVTNMQADLQGGLIATNEQTSVESTYRTIYPVVNSSGNVEWRVK